METQSYFTNLRWRGILSTTTLRFLLYTLSVSNKLMSLLFYISHIFNNKRLDQFEIEEVLYWILFKIGYSPFFLYSFFIAFNILPYLYTYAPLFQCALPITINILDFLKAQSFFSYHVLHTFMKLAAPFFFNFLFVSIP